MANKAAWLKYKTWAGIRILGTNPMPVPTSDLHIDRAAYLACCLESPKMGAVQSYDRAGISGGPFHFTAIQPKAMVQGSLFKLLRHLEVAAPCEALDELWAAFLMEDCYVARDAKLRHITTGRVIAASRIRDMLAPPGGKVPKQRGPQRKKAERWARLFHNLLSDPATYHAQKEFAVEYLLRGQRKFEADFYSPYDLVSLRAATGADPADEYAYIPTQTDLALCVYHAHSVNAPGPAKKCLQATLKLFRNECLSPIAGAYLIWRLGRYKYGRWQDTNDGRNRYDHTRVKAMKSGLWPKRFFTGSEAIMPKNLSVKRPANTK